MTSIAVLFLLNVPVQKVAPIKERSVDYVSVRNQQPLLGIVLEHGGTKPIVVAVQRAWLKAKQPEQYKHFREQEVERELALRKILTTRIETWLKERSEDKDLVQYLQDRQKNIETLGRGAKEQTTQFIICTLPAKSIRRLQLSAGERRKPLWLAYRERLKDIEIRSGQSLAEELKEKAVKSPTGQVDLSARIPARGDNEHQWAARQAIIEQLYRKPVKMLGTPETIFRDKGDGQPANVEQILTKLMTSRIDSVMKELLAEPTRAKPRPVKQQWFQQAVAEAKKTDSRAAHVTLVHPDASMKQALVEAYLIGRMPDGKWRVVWKTSHSIKPEDDPELEDQIREDEQIKAITDALGGLGQQGAIDKAIRFGAATMKGQRAAEDAYVRWRDKFFDDLTTPNIRLP